MWYFFLKTITECCSNNYKKLLRINAETYLNTLNVLTHNKLIRRIRVHLLRVMIIIHNSNETVLLVFYTLLRIQYVFTLSIPYRTIKYNRSLFSLCCTLQKKKKTISMLIIFFPFSQKCRIHDRNHNSYDIIIRVL